MTTGPLDIDMVGVRLRKRKMVDELIAIHLDRYKQSGAELIMGEARLTSATTIEVRSKDGSRTELEADQLFLNVGTHAAMPEIPGLKEAKPLTHVEALDLDQAPQHLIILWRLRGARTRPGHEALR